MITCCKFCEKRAPHCHSFCEEYLEEQKRNDKERESRRKSTDMLYDVGKVREGSKKRRYKKHNYDD